MFHQPHGTPLQSGNKRLRATPSAQSSAAIPSPALRLQVPADVFSVIYLYLPWYERLLHLSHVHRQLPAAWLVWTEYDHVRLNEALLIALTMLRPSALHCCRLVQSLCVGRVKHSGLVRQDEGDDRAEADADEYHSAQREPQPTTRLDWFVQNMQLGTVMARSQPASAAPPFGNVRSLHASHLVFHRLLDWSRLPHLYTLDLHQPRNGDFSAGQVDEDDNTRQLSYYLRSQPPLRRLRVDGVRVSYADILALPLVEHVDIRHTLSNSAEVPPVSPASPCLRHLLLDYTDTLGYGSANERVQAGHVLASLLSTSLQHLSINARLTNDDLRTISTLHSLTSLDLHCCDFDDTNALGRLISDKAEPLLPSLQRFSIEGSDAEHIDYNDMRTSTSAFLEVYSSHLRHIKLSVKTDPANSLAAVLAVIVSSMPQLESLELAIEYNSYDVARLVHEIDLSTDTCTRQCAIPALLALRSLTLRNVHVSDSALDQLLVCSPQLLELTIDSVESLTAAAWRSLLHCRQLLSFCFYAASQVATEAVFTATMPSSASSSSLPSGPTFPSLTHVGLAFPHESFVDPRGFSQLLSLFHDSPITSFALHLPDGVNNASYVSQLACMSRLTSLLLEVNENVEDDVFEAEQKSVSGHVVRLLEEFSDPPHWSSEQHHVNMRYCWQDGLLGEGEDELRAKYAAGVKTTFNVADTEHLAWSNSRAGTGYRKFREAQSDGKEEDGRVAFFHCLETSEDR